jgi:hypothetical protein
MDGLAEHGGAAGIDGGCDLDDGNRRVSGESGIDDAFILVPSHGWLSFLSFLEVSRRRGLDRRAEGN